MKFLLINGSPKGKNSNSLKLSNAFIEGIRTKAEEILEEFIIEEFHSKDMKVNSCVGCFNCWKTTSNKCVFDDDMSYLIQKILWADIVIYSFPLYYFNVPGSFKNLIDRQLPMFLPFMSDKEDGFGSGSHRPRYEIKDKRYVLISTCGFYSSEGNYDSVNSMFNHICGVNNYESIFCGQGELFSIKELSNRTNEYLDIVKRAGYEYLNGKISLDTKKDLSQLLFPKEIFEKMADASWGISKDTGEKQDESLIFTKQMAILYNKKNYDGKERVLEINYTDLDKTYQIKLDKDGSEVFENKNLDYTTRIETPFDVWKKISVNEIRGDEALAKGLYKVKGDFSLMMNWDKYFGTDQAGKTELKNNKKHPLMITMLIPWIAFWTGISIDAKFGSLIVLGIVTILPIIMDARELIIYDKISIGAVGLLSILANYTNNGSLISTIGYLIFGLVWLLSCLTKEPLSANYVKYSYNGNDSLKNPMFMKTNYILSACWGILYILTFIWTLILLKLEFGKWIVILNNIVPLLMGLFTKWFKDWYPAWVARGKQ